MNIETPRSKEFRSDNSRRSHDLYIGLLARLCLIVTVVVAPGCATTREGQSSSQDTGGKESCSRLVAAAHYYHEGFNPNNMLRRAIHDCDAGDPIACMAIPGVWPFEAIIYVTGALILIPIFMADPNIQSEGCSPKSSAMEAGATTSDYVPVPDETQFKTLDGEVGYNLWCEDYNWSACYKSMHVRADSLCGAKNYNVLSDTNSTVNSSGGTAYRINLIFQCKG